MPSCRFDLFLQHMVVLSKHMSYPSVVSEQLCKCVYQTTGRLYSDAGAAHDGEEPAHDRRVCRARWCTLMGRVLPMYYGGATACFRIDHWNRRRPEGIVLWSIHQKRAAHSLIIGQDNTNPGCKKVCESITGGYGSYSLHRITAIFFGENVIFWPPVLTTQGVRTWFYTITRSKFAFQKEIAVRIVG